MLDNQTIKHLYSKLHSLFKTSRKFSKPFSLQEIPLTSENGLIHLSSNFEASRSFPNIPNFPKTAFSTEIPYSLLHLPLLEPILVEGEAYVDAENILLDKVLGRAFHPLAADIEE